MTNERPMAFQRLRSRDCTLHRSSALHGSPYTANPRIALTTFDMKKFRAVFTGAPAALARWERRLESGHQAKQTDGVVA